MSGHRRSRPLEESAPRVFMRLFTRDKKKKTDSGERQTREMAAVSTHDVCRRLNLVFSHGSASVHQEPRRYESLIPDDVICRRLRTSR